MYVSEHLKWRILIAQALKSFHFERENANRNLKLVFEEVLAVVREKETEHPGRKTRVD